MICPVRTKVRQSFFAALLLLGWAFAAQPAEAQLKCFPSCSATDGRFLVIASGTGLVTLSEEKLDVQLAVPVGTTSFTIGVFDGDGGGVDGAGRAHWDLGTNVPYSYTLYADPLRDGTGTTVVNMLPATPSISSLTMPNNGWVDYTVAVSNDAQSPSGNYFYRLEIVLLNNATASYNSFKLRTTGVVTIQLADQPFSYIASLRTIDERGIIYPAFPSLTPTTYDGVFKFFFDIPEEQSQLAIWDGDFDRGNADGVTNLDTDDPDTPNAPFLPFWATADAVPEGVAIGLNGSTGNPPDDLVPTSILRRTPSVMGELRFPDGQMFTNNNPSGNQEWEQFRISTDSFDPSQMDFSTASIPAGTYELRLVGVDLGNLNALRLPSEALCVSEAFVPCIPLRPFLVGDTVFLDPNGNGIQSGAGETGIAGVVVELLGSLGTVISTATTDADGKYSFPVEAATYTVRIANSNFNPGQPLHGTIATAGNQKTESVINDNVLTYDFGFRGTSSLGDRLWLDVDNDGVQDGGEAGLNGVTVELLDGGGNVAASTTTAGDGDYVFDHLFPGTYSVRVVASTLPAGMTETYDLDGTGTANLASGITLGTNQDRTDVDFGYRGTASLGDRVWADANGNGVQEGGEAGLGGVTVRLFDGDGNPAGTQVTDANGNYSFTNLPAGTFTVTVDATTLPAGMVPTFDLDGTGTAHTATVLLAGGANRTDVDFGYAAAASLGDRLWYDIDGDGTQDANETGLNGVTVQLVDGNGNVIATTVTGGDGNYTFTGLAGGTYTVRIVASTLPQESAPTFDADGTATPDVATVTLATGEDRTDVDFGYRGTAALGDRVWYDLNGNGTQDADEVGLNGVTVELLDGNGDVLGSAVTSGNGGYGFAGLFPGTYTVRVDASTLPDGAVATFDLDGTGTLHTATASVASGQNLTTVDFGYRGTASLGDRVWLDLDSDGTQDAGEPGLNGVAVELLDGAGNVLASSATSSAGIYGFSNLLAGSYSVRVVSATLPPGLVQTYDLDGTGTANSATLALADGENRTDVDFGYRGTLQFGDRVWFDYDGNGVQDTGEPGLASVTVELRDASGTLIATTITGANGLYSFYNLPAGTYTVTVVASTLPGGAVPTYDLDGTATANTAVVTLVTGQNRTDVDFGYRGTASLGDRVWLDYDADGVQDAGEAGLNGVTVQLLDTNNNVIASATTAGDGNYSFPNLLAGTYKVRVVTSTLPSGAIQTHDLDGTGTAHLATATVAAGQARTDADFGYQTAAPGTGTIGYWKNHPQAWPVSTITIGGVVYTRDQAIVLIGTPSRGDKSIDLFKQLAASKLSVLVGNNPSCIYQTIASADAWMAAHPPGSNVSSGSSAWTQASPWHTQLDNYNNGNLCAPHRG
jgi:hypothetical protein